MNAGKLIEKGIRLVWDSLQSHLPYAYSDPSPEDLERGETKEFHIKCVKEYHEITGIFIKLYTLMTREEELEAENKKLKEEVARLAAQLNLCRKVNVPE